jgi:Bacteriophage protein of unknown function (DUF646).
MANINIDQLAGEIARGLSEYSHDVVEKVNASSDKVGKAAVKRLKQTSPKKSGDYAKSWTIKTEPEIGQPHKRIIHNKAPEYRKAHLLEYGHAKKGGGRVEGKPHIRPAEEQVIRDFTAEVEEAIRNG